jgi:hypothetical protein
MQRDGYLVLYNPISNEGHLDSWHVLFADLLLQLGWGVILVTTDPQSLQQKCIQKGLNKHPRFILSGTETSDEGLRVRLRKFVMRFDRFCDQWIFRRSTGYRVLAQVRQFISNLRNKALKAVAPSVAVTHLSPLVFQQQVNSVIQTKRGEVRAVFNLYIDAFIPEPVAWVNFALIHNTPWMGLSITPRLAPTEGYYLDPSYKGTCVLDENACQQLTNLLPGKNFSYLPDITETALPKSVSHFAQDILNRANGRSIVFLGGSIGKQKNLARWYDLIASVDPSDWFFLQVGRLNKNNLSEQDQAALAKVQMNMPKNLYIEADFVPDETYFNELISISSVIFAVYRDFKRSSNMLSKAAYFEKPILVSDEFLMGARVRQYGIGRPVPPDDVTQMHTALLECRQSPPAQAQYVAYRAAFNELAMQTSLDQFIRACLVSKPASE